MPALAEQYVPQCSVPEVRKRTAVMVWCVLAALVLVWIGAILAAPLALARGHVALAQLLYLVFDPLCHQIPERSFHLEGHAFAVCARCTGIYTGFAASVLFYPVARRLQRTDTPARMWLLLAGAPTLIDWTLGFTGIWENTHWSRFGTGALLGAVCAFYVVPGLIDMTQINWRLYFFSRNATSAVGAHQPAALPVRERVAESDYGSPSSRI